MARKNKTSKPTASRQPATAPSPAPSAPVVVSPIRVLALGAVGLFIITMFLWSFISRMSGDTRFEDRRPRMGQQGGMPPMPEGMGESMPPAMAEAMEKARQSGQQVPQGMPGQAMAGMDNEGMNRVGAMMRQMQGDPNNATVLAMLADEFMQMQDWEAAVSFLNRALVAEPANARVMGLLGISHFNMKEYEVAAQYFESLLAVEADNAGAHYNLGMIYTRFLNKPEEGRRLLEAMLQLPTATEGLRREAKNLLDAQPASGPASEQAPGAGTDNASSS